MRDRHDWERRRAEVVQRDGARCIYCRVPTAATIEHLQARTKGGSHWSPNLALACPYCNQRKSNRELPDFLASGDWKLARPADLPERTRDIGRGELGCAQSASTVSA